MAFHRGQLKELCTQYHPDLLWFDGDWERDPDQWRFAQLRDQLQEWAPGVIVNSRMGGYGDYATPEQAIPIQAPPSVWELCLTSNDHWGYFEGDTNFKTPRQCIRTLAECAGMGGNFLLDIGPKADGTLQREQTELLQKIGRWTGKHAEALSGTTRGLPVGHFYGPSTLSADKRTLYLFVFEIPRDEISVKGIQNPLKKVSVLGSNRELKHHVSGGAPWDHVPGVTWIEVPQTVLDEDVTVIKIEFDEPLDLYLGASHQVVPIG